MTIDVLIARWVAVFWIVLGLSHALYPAKWAALLMPLRERETGGLLLAALNFPLGLMIVLGHNVWTWDLPLIVTVAGWLTTLKSAAYLLLPRAHAQVMSLARHPQRAFQAIGLVMVLLGAITAYDAFFRR